MFSFILNLCLQINTLNLHIFANKLIYYLFLRVVAEFMLIILYTLLYIKKKRRTASHPWETSSSHRRTASHPPKRVGAYSSHQPDRRAGSSHLSAAEVSRLNEGSRVFSEVGISLIINYLSSPVGR